MLQFKKKWQTRHVPVCDHCGMEIKSRSELYVLRAPHALPEDPAFHVHERCCERFIRHHGGGDWEQFGASSPQAAWYLW